MNSKSIIGKKDREILIPTPRLKSIIIGMLLSDGWMQIRKGWNPRIGFKQSIKNFPYIWELFNELSIISSNYPYLCKNIKRGKLFYSIKFETRQLKSLNNIKDLLYNENNVKSIKFELIYHFNYLVLAHWIMGDGSKRNKGITLCTDNFTIKEVVMLINILMINFKIDPTLHMEKGKPRIYINGKDLNKI